MFAISLTVSEILSARVLDIWRIIGTVLWGTLQIVNMKSAASDNGMEDTEDGWGFGQIVPLLLLGLPLMSVWEVIEGQSLINQY